MDKKTKTVDRTKVTAQKPQNKAQTATQKKTQATQKRPIQRDLKPNTAGLQAIKKNDDRKLSKKANGSKSEKNKTKDSKKIPKELNLSYAKLVPIVRMVDDGNSGFLLNDGTYMNIFRIIGQDYEGMMEYSIVIQCIQTERFYITMEDNNPKIVNISLPLDTRKDQAYRERMKAKCKNPEYKRINEEAIKELKKLSNRQCKQSYLEIYADDYEKLRLYNSRVMSILCSEGLVYDISPQEKIRYLQKKNNPYNYGY